MCWMNYGSEIENPDWNGKLTTNCEIPSNLGTMSFQKNTGGVDFSPIQRYCAVQK